MSDVAVRAENLSKLYRIGERDRYFTLRDTIMNFVRRPLARFSDNGNGVSSSSLAESTIWALKDVSFEVKRGEVVGIIGRNGAGKSTLLKVVSRILRPTAGQVWVRGSVAPLIELGAGFHPELTGRENVYLNGAMLGFSQAEMQARFEGIVEFAELWDFIDAPLRTYSSGMMTRLGFAVASDVDPDILIIDEVLSVGDEAFQQKCLARMRSFRAKETTILFVSHGLDAVERLCDRAIWIDQGGVRHSGGVRETAEAYLETV